MTHASVHADAKPGSLNHSCFPCTCLSVGAIAALAEKQKALCLQFCTPLVYIPGTSTRPQCPGCSSSILSYLRAGVLRTPTRSHRRSFLMTSYYIDPERCFEVPFRIPLPDRDEMATRLANIRVIIKHARERQSLSNVEHRRKHPTRPGKYRDRANAIIKCGRLKRFVGDLTGQYLDYLNFHQERLNDMSPLAIQVPALCSPLSPPQPYLLYVNPFEYFERLKQFHLAVPQDKEISMNSSEAISRGPNLRAPSPLGGERGFSKTDDGNFPLNAVPWMSTQMRVERSSMLPWSPREDT
jgi:hypothetical protein